MALLNFKSTLETEFGCLSYFLLFKVDAFEPSKLLLKSLDLLWTFKGVNLFSRKFMRPVPIILFGLFWHFKALRYLCSSLCWGFLLDWSFILLTDLDWDLLDILSEDILSNCFGRLSIEINRVIKEYAYFSTNLNSHFPSY